MQLHHQNPNKSNFDFSPVQSKGQRRSLFTWQNILLNLVLISFLVFINKVGLVGNAIFYVVLTVMALKNSEGALKALSLSLMATTINSSFVSLSIVFAIGRLVILFVVAGRFMLDLSKMRGDFMRRGYVWLLFGFCAVVAMGSVMNGYFVVVSLLKLLAFSAGVFAILLGADVVRVRSSDLTCWCFSLIIFCVLLGVVAQVIGAGYGAERNGVISPFFKGAFSHSQTLGAIGGLMLVYLFTIYLFSPYRYKLFTLCLAAVLTYQVYLTASRTGISTAVIGCAATLCLAYLAPGGRRQVRFHLPRLQLAVMAGVGFILMIFVNFFTGNSLGKGLTSILLKYEGSEALSWEVLFQTRMPLIEFMIANFKTSPLTGIGFGTSYDPGFAAKATWYTAPIEKGVLPLAVLEETGLSGSLFFWAFIIFFLIYLIRERNISGFGIFIAMLVANLGEMMFFSFGGAGGMCWFVVAAGLVLSDRCLTSQGPGGGKLY
jgi:hypothetical protein